MSSFRFLLGIITLILITYSCSYKEIELIQVENMNIEKINNKGIVLSTNATINNPNNYNIKVKANNLDVKLAGKDIGKASLNPGIKLKKNKQDVYPVKLHIKNTSLAGGVMQAIPSLLLTGSTGVSVKGKLKGRVFLYTRKFDIDEEKNLDFGNGMKGLFK